MKDIGYLIVALFAHIKEVCGYSANDNDTSDGHAHGSTIEIDEHKVTFTETSEWPGKDQYKCREVSKSGEGGFSEKRIEDKRFYNLYEDDQGEPFVYLSDLYEIVQSMSGLYDNLEIHFENDPDHKDETQRE